MPLFSCRPTIRTELSSASRISASRLALALAALLMASLASVPAQASFDPEASPAVDLAAAMKVAQEQGKHILMEVGGEWCSWCRLLDKTWTEDAELASALAADFVLLKVNFSDENKNEAFLAPYPEINGYPHIFVLDEKGTILESKDTAELEAGAAGGKCEASKERGYCKAALLDFFAEWKHPAGEEAADSGR